ncbi:MAG: T9SS type A sorting domain-containing protein [Saprospiraceae bacterium]|nr:T9SS type A sorting domain-containing protein [Saprospiraceae bacterium]
MKQLYQRLPLMLLMLCPFFLQAQLSSITEVTLTFTPSSGSAITAKATDADGNGLVVDGPINLAESTDYTLDIELRNVDQNTNITDEVTANPERYQFFFETPGDIISGDIAYDDVDANSLPVGLASSFTSECVEAEGATGSLRILLSDLMSDKMANSAITDGTAQFDVTWTVNVADAPDAPPCENEEEIITDVVLTWTPVGGGDPVVATAKDPDGEGIMDLAVEGPINLLESTEYTLTLELRNDIEGEDITAEIMEEDDEHMFFFAFTDEVFASPAGDGNVDNRADPVNYDDQDENGLPVGLSTSWTTECGEENGTGTFRLILKHQPDIKSATSTVDDGGTDVDLTFTVNVAEDPDAPACENEEEIITDVILTWTPVDGGDPVVATAKDPDGEGIMDLEVEGPINLLESTEYTLTLELRNEIEGEDITTEIMEEDDEHMFFFGFTEGIFSSPEGDGNIDNRADAVNYNDQDENGLPVGLSTGWTTATTMAGGSFRVVLKHQPDIKSETSTADDGGTDVDLTFVINTDITDVDDPIGVDEQALVLSPNPVQQELNWKLENASSNDPVDILIFNTSGQLVKRYRSPAPTIDVSKLNPGVYIFQLQQEQQILSKRFVKTQ